MKIRIKTQADDPATAPVCYGGRHVYIKATEPMDFKAPVIVFDNKRMENTVLFDEGIITISGITIPDGYEARVRLRKGLMNTESITNKAPGTIAYTSLKEQHADKGDIIGEIEISPSATATFWQKLKWLLSDGIEIINE